MPNDPQNDRRVLDPEIISPDSQQQSWSKNSSPNSAYYGVWTSSPFQQGGCGAACITFLLFFICLGQYGLLAAIGFLVFHVIGSILGSIYQARQLMAGILVNPWGWRAANWVVSFMLTVWLAGGFND